MLQCVGKGDKILKKVLVLIGLLLLIAMPAAAQDDDTKVVVLPLFDIMVDMPAGWAVESNDDAHFIAEDPNDLNRSENVPLSGAVLSLESVLLTEAAAAGYDGELELNQMFEFAAAVVEFEGETTGRWQLFDIEMLEGRGELEGYPAAMSIGYDELRAYIMLVVAPTEADLDAFWSELGRVMSTARPVDFVVTIPDEYNVAPAGVTLFSDYDSFVAYIDAMDGTDPAADQAAADALMDELRAAEAIPLVFGPQVFFIYQRATRTVDVAGDFNSWNEGVTRLEQVADTDLWVREMTLPIDARVEYKLVVNNSWLNDPNNADRQMGGFGPNTVLRMPAFTSTDFTDPRNSVSHGTLSEDILISSAAMGYDLVYNVYTPAGYENLGPLPVMYVTDGNDFSHREMGAMTIVADNVVADGLSEPVMIVFIDARTPSGRTNRRETEYLENPNYATFVAEELVPEIDANYNTTDDRMIVGTSFGGVAALFISIEYPEVFDMVTAFSPATWAAPDLVQRYRESDSLPYDVWMSVGDPRWDVGSLAYLVESVQMAVQSVTLVEVPEGHSWGHWSELTDEMLMYFFGTE